MGGYLAGSIQVGAIDGQIVALVIFDFLVEFLVDGIRVEDEGRESGLRRQVLHADHVVHDESVIVDLDRVLRRDRFREGDGRRAALHPRLGQHDAAVGVHDARVAHVHFRILIPIPQSMNFKEFRNQNQPKHTKTHRRMLIPVSGYFRFLLPAASRPLYPPESRIPVELL